MGRVIELFVDQFLTLDQGTGGSNPTGLAVFQTLAITDHAKNYRTVAEVHQFLHIGQQVELRRSVLHISVSQTMPMYQQGGSGPSLQTVTQFLWIGQSARYGPYESLAQTLAMTDLATCTVSKSATNTLSMTDLATCNVHRSLVVVHTLVVGSGAAGFLLDEDTYSIPLPTITGPGAPEAP